MDDSAAWVIFFGTVVGMQFHPGYSRDGSKPLDLAECALVADMMVQLYKERFLCQSQQPQ